MLRNRWWQLAASLTLGTATVFGVLSGPGHPPVQDARLTAQTVSVPAPAKASAGAYAWGRGGDTMLPGPAAQGAAAPGMANATATTSENWSGYAATGGQFTSVSAAWTQPAVTCTAQDTFSSFWVGLDGDGTQTVEQTGTEADCASGTAAYSGWYEMFPANPVTYSNPVQPGDAMSASVTTSGNGTFTLTLTDQTQGWNQVTTQTSATAQLGSAEVIAEAPSSTTGVLRLSNFGTVHFTAATANGAPIGNNASLSELTMVSAGGATEATPSALTGGNAFSVAWNSSGS
jgi:Peptidase A4 family